MTISEHLTDLLRDWQGSRSEFQNSAIQGPAWPIPFFGNPATAIVATVGVNPSSGEFAPDRRWGEVDTLGKWKHRLRDYFKIAVPAHEWFEPWAIELELLLLLFRCCLCNPLKYHPARGFTWLGANQRVQILVSRPPTRRPRAMILPSP